MIASERVYLSPDVAAVFLGIDVQTLANWRCKKVGVPYHKLNNHLIRYDLRDLESYLERSRVETTA
jgi:hypothetical protein